SLLRYQSFASTPAVGVNLPGRKRLAIAGQLNQGMFATDGISLKVLRMFFFNLTLFIEYPARLFEKIGIFAQLLEGRSAIVAYFLQKICNVYIPATRICLDRIILLRLSLSLWNPGILGLQNR